MSEIEVRDDHKLPYIVERYPKPNGVLGGSIRIREFFSILDEKTSLVTMRLLCSKKMFENYNPYRKRIKRNTMPCCLPLFCLLIFKQDISYFWSTFEPEMEFLEIL